MEWGFPPANVWPRYLVVNGDESEPGTYKDRMLMERDPHQLIEGCLIACYAVGLSQAFLYVRGEMALAQERIAGALNEAYAAGYVGKNILGTDFSVDIDRTFALLSDVPAGKAVVSESGLESREQLEELERVGVDAVLIGESLLRADDIEAACRALSGPDGEPEP